MYQFCIDKNDHQKNAIEVMKNLLFFAIQVSLLFMAGMSSAQTISSKNTEIRLHIDGLTSSWIQLQQVHENKISMLDSIQTDKSGNAAFVFQTRLEPGYYEMILPNERLLPLILDQDQTVAFTTDTGQLISHMQVSGSLENTLLYNGLQYDWNLGRRFQAEIESIQSQNGQLLDDAYIDQLRQKYFAERETYYKQIMDTYADALFSKYELAKQRPAILYRIIADSTLDQASRQQRLLSAFWDNMDFSDERLLHTPVAFDKLREYLNNYVPNETSIKIQAIDLLMEKVAPYPDWYKFFATWIADDYLPPFNGQMDPDAIYIHMVDHYLTKDRAPWADSIHLYAYQFRSENMRPSLVGMVGQNIQAKDTAGQDHLLDEIKSPYVALFFYHTDCEHCIKETPLVVEQYRKLKDQGLEVMAIAMSPSEDEWKAFIAKNEMDWINVTDDDNPDVYKKYFVRATPEIYLLNPDRTIIGKHLTAEDIPKLMQLDQMGYLKKTEMIPLQNKNTAAGMEN